MAPSGFLSVERHGENKCVSVSVWHKSQRTTHVHKSKRGVGGGVMMQRPLVGAVLISGLILSQNSEEEEEEMLDGPHL